MIAIKDISITPQVQNIVTPQQAWHYSIIPKKEENGALEFYVSDKAFDTAIIDELEILLGKSIQTEQVADDVIQKALAKYYRNSPNGKRASASNVTSDNIQANDFLPMLISEAKKLGSSHLLVRFFAQRIWQ